MKIFLSVFFVFIFFASFPVSASDQSVSESTNNQDQINVFTGQNIGAMEKEIADLKIKIRELESRIEHLTKLVETLIEQQKVSKQTSESEKSKIQTTNKIKTEENPEYVYVSKSGKKYHRQNCRFLVGEFKQMTLEEAKKKKLERCKLCFPETENTQNKKEKDK